MDLETIKSIFQRYSEEGNPDRFFDREITLNATISIQPSDKPGEVQATLFLSPGDSSPVYSALIDKSIV